MEIPEPVVTCSSLESTPVELDGKSSNCLTGSILFQVLWIKTAVLGCKDDIDTPSFSVFYRSSTSAAAAGCGYFPHQTRGTHMAHSSSSGQSADRSTQQLSMLYN